MVIEDYNLQPHYVRFAEHPQKGFVGTCTYLLRGPDEVTDADAPLTVRQQIVLLSQLVGQLAIGLP